MAAALSRQVPITEYMPKRLKWPLQETETPLKNSGTDAKVPT